MRFIQTLFAATVVVSLTGCLNDTMNCLDDISFGLRNHMLAVGAWHTNSDCYKNVDHKHHFKKGYLQGYKAHAESGAECPPALPPRSYWSVHYADYKGKQKQLAWYNGYEHGLFAAQQEGVQEGSKIYTPIEAAPLCPPKAEHQIVDEQGNPTPVEEPGNIPPSPLQDGTPPAVPPAQEFNTFSEEEPLSNSEAKPELQQPMTVQQIDEGEPKEEEFELPESVNEEKENDFSFNQIEEQAAESYVEYRAISHSEIEAEGQPTFSFAEYRAIFKTEKITPPKAFFTEAEEKEESNELRGFFEDE